MRFRDVLLFKWVALLYFLDKAGVTPRGLKLTVAALALIGLSFWAGTAHAGYLWAN